MLINNINKFKTRLLALMLAVCLISVLFSSCSAEASLLKTLPTTAEVKTAVVKPFDGKITDENYIQAAQSDALRLYVNTENLGIKIENIATGQITNSVAEADDSVTLNTSWKGFVSSGFAIEYYNERSPIAERLDAYNGNPEINLKLLDNGFEAVIYYVKAEVGFTLKLALTDNGVSVLVPSDSFKEGENSRLSALYLYPFMSATKLGDEVGYMVIPEGSGALIELNNWNGKYKSPYTKRIYGDNPGTRKQTVTVAGKWASKKPVNILAPFYGIALTEKQNAVLAVIESGEYNAEILAYPNGAVTDYNWITARFILREQYTMQTTRTQGVLSSEKDGYFRDIRTDFYFLYGENANYSDMALFYRDWLLDSGKISKKDTDYKTRVDFFGSDSEEWFLSYQSVNATSITQAEEIVFDMINRNIPLSVIYKGWQSGGITKNYGSTDLSVDKYVGSNSKIIDFSEMLEKNNTDFFLYQDLLYANPESFYNTSRDIAKGVNQVIMEVFTYTEPFSYLYYLTPYRAGVIAESISRKFAGNNNIGIAAGTLPNTLFSYYSESTVFNRGDCAEGFYSAVANLSDNGKTALEQPFSYLWSETDVFMDFPLYTSNYSFISEEIPFLAMALNGIIPLYSEYVNFMPNEREYFLRMIEYGVYPSFIITAESPGTLRNTNSSFIYSSEYDVFSNQIETYSKAVMELLEITEKSRIVKHKILENGLVCVYYENNVFVCINYSDSAKASGNLYVEGMSYEIYTGEGAKL